MNGVKKEYRAVAYTSDGSRVEVKCKCLHRNGDRAIVVSQSRLCIAIRDINGVWYIKQAVYDYVDVKCWLNEGIVL